MVGSAARALEPGLLQRNRHSPLDQGWAVLRSECLSGDAGGAVGTSRPGPHRGRRRAEHAGDDRPGRLPPHPRPAGDAGGGPLLAPAIPLVALADEGTASGGEVIAAAVQEYQRGTLVGTRTAGALLAGLYVALPGGAAIAVAVERVTTGKGVVVEKTGVQPDVEVELTTEDLERGVDAQFQRALQQLMQRVLAPAA